MEATSPSGTVSTMVRLAASAAARFRMPRSLAAFVATLAVLLAALTLGVAPAAAKTPCWKKLLNDEFDGRIDKTYPVYCYHQALGRLHEDVRTYGSAYNDINRALQSAILGYHSTHRGGGPPPPDWGVPPEKGAIRSHNHPENFFQRVANAIGPGNATSLPLPLLILAGVGVLLVAAAAASYAARRIRARRLRPQPATVPPTPRRK
jgi:hypothetical protein